jgi:uncharacterized protein YcbK (DUF882 family)
LFALPHPSETGRVPILSKRMPLAGGLLIATSVLALSGCVSDKKALDSAAVETASPAAQTAAAAQPAEKAATPAPYRDPLVTNVSGVRPQQQAAAAGQNVPAAAMPAADPAMAAPAGNIGGLVLQPTRINAQAMSIFSARPAVPQNNASSTVIEPPGANAYAPVGQAVAPARASVYSAPDAPPQQEPVQPQQSSQNTGAPGPVRSASLATGAVSGPTMALYSAPKQNLLGSLSGLLQTVSLPGMTRVAPNGLHVQNDTVQVGCFKPDLMKVIKTVERHFGRPVVVTSGYRDEEHNRDVGGADESMHKSCEAADIQIDGVSKRDIAAYVRSLPGRGGVGTYCHTESVHIDTGNARDWNWGCGRKQAPAATARAI